MSIANDEWSNIALKLLSIFDYISYEILGGEEPEIFIRLNDPQKVKNIVHRKLPFTLITMLIEPSRNMIEMLVFF